MPSFLWEVRTGREHSTQWKDIRLGRENNGEIKPFTKTKR